MLKDPPRRNIEKARLIILPSILAAFFGYLLSVNSTNQRVHAFSTGPPAGYTGAPGEFTCAECHVPPDAGTGRISISAPASYVPGQTYPVSVTHLNSDLTRRRWGFQLTALDPSDEKAGNLQSSDVFTQVLDNQGPGGARQYIEHTSAGTFGGQSGGASWQINWTAPQTDVGPVTFYVAGNQANNDGNSSGDYIYFTFVAVAPAATTPDLAISVTPSSQSLTPGGTAAYSVTVTPLAGFIGSVNLSASGLPSGASANFSPATLNMDDPSSHSSNLTITTDVTAPVGQYTINISAAAGSVVHGASATLKIVDPMSVDLSLGKTASPNPGQAGLNLSYRLTVTNHGPGAATSVGLTDPLPMGVVFVSASASQGSCMGTDTINCSLGNLASGGSTIVTIVVTPTASGQISNTATVAAAETDFDPGNNSSTVSTFIQAAASLPSMLDPNLTVSTVFAGLNQPTSIVFLGAEEFLVLERTTGKVQRIVNGTLAGPVLDLAVNGASERGLLGIALHPRFPENGFVYIFWTQSMTGIDSVNIDDVPLLGNRVDRYIWNGSNLTFDRNLIRLRALQQDVNQPSRGNHNGGVLRFGPDGKLYIMFGDNGRRGFVQNVTSGGPVPDDQFGGPEPDDAHLTGVVLRLNDDGTTPDDNPFFNSSTGLTAEAAADLKKIFAYGVRNGFGMAFDPLTNNLWTQENGDDAFDELNRVRAGFNGGWIQLMGPLNRIEQFKSIETTYAAGTLQQLRWPTANIADTPQSALSRLYTIPPANYFDPEFSWKYAVAPSPIGFIKGRGLGPQFEGDLLVGGSRTTLVNGYLFRFKFNSDRQHFAFADQRLTDLVADNNDKFDLTESESLLVGRDFGVTTDIQTGPNGNVFVVSLSNGAIYEIKSLPHELFVANLTGAQEVPATSSNATGTATLLLSPDQTTARVSLVFSGLTAAQTAAHIHGPAAAGSDGPVLFPLPVGQVSDLPITLTPDEVQNLKHGLLYVNVHSSAFVDGEIRGQFQASASASSFQFGATSFVISEGGGSATIAVTRLGNTANELSIEYSTSNGTASNRTDFITSSGSLNFAAGETSKQFSVPIVDDAYVEGSETIILNLVGDDATFLGSPAIATLTILDNDVATPAVNPLEEAQFFVRQLYLDLLNREPDAGGFAYWTNEITNCGNNSPCVDSRRISVAASFFLSQEFQDSGQFVYGLYQGGLGRLPGYAEFVLDRSRVIGGPELEANRAALADDFVKGAEFRQLYPTSQTNAQFVDALFDTAGLIGFTVERQQEIDAMDAGKTRAQVLSSVISIPEFQDREFNSVFILMEYFGFLQRDPEAAGYAFWLDVLANRQANNFRGLVCAFITSTEYQQRFSSIVSRTNAECRGVR